MPGINVSTHLDTTSKIESRTFEGTDWISINPGFSHGTCVDVHLNERAAERLVVVATEHYRKMIKNDLKAAREVAETVQHLLSGGEASALLAEGGAPSILVDTLDGRSFVVDVREV